MLNRFTPSLIGLAAFSIVIALQSAGAHAVYTALLSIWGVTPFRFPFLDLSASLAAWDCARHGMNVMLSDPCDVLNRPYIYGPVWMTIDWIPLTRDDLTAVGLSLGAAFLLSLAALPPATSRGELIIRTLASLSTMVAFAIERANPDLLIFLLVILAVTLLRRALPVRLLGYGAIFLAGAIKYYPFILLTLMARERLRLFIATAAAAIIGLLVFYHIYAAEILEGLPNIPGGSPFGDMFGAKNVLFGMFLIIRGITGAATPAWAGAAAAGAALFAALTTASFRLWRRSDIPAALYRLDDDHRLTLMAGALLLIGCFFSGQNVGYRGIYLLFPLPGLYALSRDKSAGSLATAARLAAWSIPILMWAEGLRLWIHMAATGHVSFPLVNTQPIDFLIWLFRELAWWALITLCLTLTAAFATRLPPATWRPRRDSNPRPQD